MLTQNRIRGSYIICCVVENACYPVTRMTVEFFISAEIYEFCADAAVNQKPPEKPDRGCEIETVYSV